MSKKVTDKKTQTGSGKTKKNNNKMSSFMLTQALDEKRWSSDKWGEFDFSEDGFSLAEFCKTATGLIIEAGVDGSVIPQQVAAIVHDRDVHEREDGTVEPKLTHVHFILKFKKDKGLSLSGVAKALGVEQQYIERPKSGRYSWDNMLAYLIHAKDSDKYQYDPKEVVSGGKNDDGSDFNYQAYHKKHADRWWKSKAVKESKVGLFADRKGLKDALFRRVVINEEFNTREDFVEVIGLDNDFFATYVKHKREIDGWFDALDDRRFVRLSKAMRDGAFSTKVVFITGKAGSGKTSVVAKGLIDAYKAADPTMRVFYGGSEHPVDDYKGEEIVLLDDLRGYSMNAVDWLKLLDPYNASPNKARYKNRTVVAQHIIITSVQDVYEFFYFVKGIGKERDEPLGQFIRRLMAVINVVRVDRDMRFNQIGDVKAGEFLMRVSPIERGDERVFVAGATREDGRQIRDGKGELGAYVDLNHHVDTGSAVAGRVDDVLPEVAEILMSPHVDDAKAGLKQLSQNALEDKKTD